MIEGTPHEVTWVEVNEISPHPKNPNKHSKEQIDRLAKIILGNGFRVPLIVSRNSGRLVSGHGRLAAAKQAGFKRVPVIYQTFNSEDAEYAHLVADNAIANWAELDLSSINTDLQDLGPDFDIDLLGIKDFVLEPADKYGDKDADATPETRATSIARGDLYSLGNHRLLCGDSTCVEDVQKLMNGEKADMVFTDPPYGVSAVNKTGHVGVSGATGWGKTSGEANSAIYKKRTYRRIEGDDKPFEPDHLLGLSQKIILWGANYYSDKLPQSDKWLVWDKKGDGVGADGNSFSDCELAWTSLEGRSVRIYRHLWSGLLREGDRKEELKERVHPTQKPVGLNAQILLEFTKEQEIIADLYLGSGSTLIACEKTNRKCYGMEIDPQYCQVIIDRWEKFTGQKAVKIEA